jgi:hypothetical protein
MQLFCKDRYHTLDKLTLCMLSGSLLYWKNFTCFAVSNGCFIVTVVHAAVSTFRGCEECIWRL